MWLALTLAIALGPADARTLAFDLTDEGAIVVPVWVEGQGPFRFLLDTGASRSAITARFAHHLATPIRGTTVMLTPSGHRTPLGVARLNAVRIGPVTVPHVDVTIVSAESIRAAPRIDGIIGQDVLARWVYTIDYRRRLILWHPEGVTVAGVRLPLDVHQDGRVLVVLTQPGEDGVRLRMIPDSGSDGVVLFARPGQRLPGVTPLDVGLLRTVAGHRLVRRVRLDSFSAGDVRLDNLMAVLVPRSDTDSPDGDGLLPLHIFSAVTLNVAEKTLVIHR
jgi:predicted aspartyl protease